MQQLRKYKNTFSLSEDVKPVSVDISKVPRIKDVMGTGNKYFKDINHMSHEQKFPVISDDFCVNCGKCYMTCLDSGYQAISFDSKTHKPIINQDCTGCGLCFAVCPVPGALEYG
jgi:dihydropyrimidine dehydrogenase (NADP+)